MKILLCGKVELEWKKEPGCSPVLKYITPYFDQDNCPISPVKTYCKDNEEWEDLLTWIKELNCGGGEAGPNGPGTVDAIGVGKGLEKHGCVYDRTDPENPICKGYVYLCHKSVVTVIENEEGEQTTTTTDTAEMLYISADASTLIQPYAGEEGDVEKCLPSELDEECEPYIGWFPGNAVPTDQEFHAIGVEKPKCCTVIITTSAGAFRIGPYVNGMCPEVFKCPVKFISMEVTGPTADCTAENVIVTLQKLA